MKTINENPSKEKMGTSEIVYKLDSIQESIENFYKIMQKELKEAFGDDFNEKTWYSETLNKIEDVKYQTEMLNNEISKSIIINDLPEYEDNPQIVIGTK